ncbi:MAG: GTPase HflX [Clostridiales bacterium]|jgi:GTP-binding protein HflX|nr:GTPase HflX [Clostridiales bacterium]
MHDLKKEQALAILVGIDTGQEDIELSMAELAELARTADTCVCGVLTQKRSNPHPATYLGKGKLDELAEMLEFAEITPNILIFNDELSPAQFRNLSDRFDCNIIDRSILILDIFAAGAHSAEGKLQVELAQLNYRLSRLSGLGKMLSRLGGGIGTRGPGETKLETDRRHIRRRVDNLRAELKEIRQNRDTMRKRRERSGAFVAALVGYTNAGKSSILNLVAGGDEVYVADKLFATLDTTMRRCRLPGGAEILLSDTVGFIEKLPHHLIQAFKATLEELSHADVLIFVIDASHPQREQHRDVVLKTLADLNLSEKKTITVYNKMDLDIDLPLPAHPQLGTVIEMSARTGEGKDYLLSAIEEAYNSGRTQMSVLIPYSESRIAAYIHENCEILSHSHEEQGDFFELIVDDEAKNRLAKFRVVMV